MKIAWRDAKERKIGNLDVMLLFLLGAIHLSVGKDIGILECIGGGLVISLPLLILAVLAPGGFGGGDIKLIAAGGFYLGMDRIVKAALIALLFAGIYCLWKVLVKKQNKKTQFALGPFLCLGMALAGG